MKAGQPNAAFNRELLAQRDVLTTQLRATKVPNRRCRNSNRIGIGWSKLLQQHRNSDIWVKVATWFATAIFCSCASYGDDFNQKKETLIASYMKFAFAQNERLVKFARRPVISFLCLSSYCEGVAQEAATHFPIKSKYSITKSPSKEPAINILFVGPNSPEGNAFEYKTDAGQSLHSWGTKSCNVFQIRRNDTVEKAIIILNESEGKLNNIACILYELPRASGGNIVGEYEKYAQAFGSYSDQTRKKVVLNIEFILRMHWSELVPPGTDKQTTRQLIEENIQ